MSRRRYRGSVIGTYVKPTTTTASGVYDLDTAIINTGIARWPAATYGLYRTPAKALFAFGYKYSGSGTTNVYNDTVTYISDTGNVVSDNAITNTPRQETAACGYGTDKAVFQGGRSSAGGATVDTYNLVSNTGVIDVDVSAAASTSTGQARCAATYRTDYAIFAWGIKVISYYWDAIKGIDKMNNLGVWISTEQTTYYYQASTAAGYGNGSAYIFANGRQSQVGATYSVNSILYYSSVSDTGVISAQYVSPTNASVGLGTRYGVDTSVVFTFGYNAATKMICYISNTGVFGSDQTVTRTQWDNAGVATYKNGYAIISGGYLNNTALYTSRPKGIITNTGVIGTETTEVSGNRTGLAGSGYSLT